MLKSIEKYFSFTDTIERDKYLTSLGPEEWKVIFVVEELFIKGPKLFVKGPSVNVKEIAELFEIDNSEELEKIRTNYYIIISENIKEYYLSDEEDHLENNLLLNDQQIESILNNKDFIEIYKFCKYIDTFGI